MPTISEEEAARIVRALERYDAYLVAVRRARTARIGSLPND